MRGIEESNGIILSTRKYKERDYLIKIFLEDFGKLMFFVRGSKKKNNIYSSLRPYVEARFIVDVRESGLSFIRDVKDLNFHKNIQSDIFLNAYVTYISALIDSSLEDRLISRPLYRQLAKGLEMIDQGFDAEIITNIFELKLLYYFGVMPNFQACAVCEKTEGVFDYSDKFNGILCSDHFYMDDYRYHAHPNVIYLIQKFTSTDIAKLKQINLGQEIKDDLRRVIDLIYEHLVGINLKSKKFIDEMKSWGSLLE